MVVRLAQHWAEMMVFPMVVMMDYSMVETKVSVLVGRSDRYWAEMMVLMTVA